MHKGFACVKRRLRGRTIVPQRTVRFCTQRRRSTPHVLSCRCLVSLPPEFTKQSISQSKSTMISRPFRYSAWLLLANVFRQLELIAPCAAWLFSAGGEILRVEVKPLKMATASKSLVDAPKDHRLATAASFRMRIVGSYDLTTRHVKLHFISDPNSTNHESEASRTLLHVR
jgi:hypothetical protein